MNVTMNHQKPWDFLRKSWTNDRVVCPGDVQREARHRNGVGVFILLLFGCSPAARCTMGFHIRSQYETRTSTWWLIPLSKRLITQVIGRLSLLIPLITGVIIHLLTGMSHQVLLFLGVNIPGKGYLDKWMCTLKCHCKVDSMASNVYPDKI